MKKYILITICLFSCLLNLSAQMLTEAETAYQKNDFAAAKTIYEQVLQTAHGPELWQAQLRLGACQYYLGEFLQAAKSLLSYPLPQDPHWKARFLLYRVYLSNAASSIYSPTLTKNEIISAQAATDPAQWTREQWQRQIDQDYRLLWELRQTLLDTPTEQENLILNLKDTDTKRIPTLFDFAVTSWQNYLQQYSSLEVKPLSADTPRFLDGTSRLKEGSRKATTLLISQLLEAAATAQANTRQNAVLFWQTDAILQPLSTENFVLENKEAAYQKAQEQLKTLYDVQKPVTSWWQRIKNRFNTKQEAQPDYGRSYVMWQLAKLYNDREQYAKALEICQQTKELTPSYFTQSCDELAQEITRVELRAETPDKPFNRQHPVLSFSGKNLSHVYIQLYATSFEELEHLAKNYNSWNTITELNKQKIVTIAKRQPIHIKAITIEQEEVGKTQKGSFELPAQEPGFYVVLMSTQKDFSADKSNLHGWVLNATDLAIFATAAIDGQPNDYIATRTAATKTLHPNIFHLYTVNLRTGQPEPHTALRILTGYNQSEEKAQTNAKGEFDIARSVIVSATQNNSHYEIAPLAQKDSSIAFTEHLYFGFYNKEPVKIFLQTDRPIYRPGQKVQLAAQAFERLPRGLKTLGQLKIQLQVTDPNGKKIFTDSPSLNALGSARTSFTLPQDALLGHYSIHASLTTNGQKYQAYNEFRMEEYKRPDYELTLQAPAKALEYGTKATLSATARYYTGVPLVNARVSYTLKRRSYVPPFYWWWAYPLEEKEKIVLQGNGVTDGQGSFTVSFTPTRQEEDEEFANYILEAQVYDESGRPITASRTYQVSAHPNLFQVDFLQGFYDANKTASLAEINLTDAEGNAVTGSITLSVSQLENRQPSVQTMPLRCYDCPSPSTHLDTLYKDFAVEKTAFTRTLNFQKPGSQTIQLPALPEGVYRLELSSPKAATQKMIFIVAKEKSALQLPNIALVQQKTYYPGENLRVLLGAGDMKGTKFVEMYQGEHFLTYRTQLPGGVQIFSFPLNQDHRGGVALRWFGADDYLFHQAQAVANVPFDNKQLQINTTIPDTVKPGQKINWKISVKDATGSPVNGLVNATVYDKSLDYYVSNRPFLTFSKLYFQNATVQRGIASNQRPSTIWYQVSRPHLNGKNLPFLPLPTLNLEMGYRRYGVATKGIAYANVGSKRSYAAKGAALNDAADEMQSLQMNMKEAAPMLAKEEFATNLATQISHTEEETIPVRTDFSETAYFNPSIPLTGGQAALQFTLPQTLTTWNLFGFALTSNVLFGGFEGSFISQKDLMLRLQMPRFYREHDHGVIQAAITNQTRKKITTAVTLSIKKDSAYALDAFGVKQPVQSVTLPPQSTQFVTWDITAPADPALYQVTAVARTASANDGEQKTLPVLPGKMRLLASTHAALKNGDNQLVLSELAGVPAQDIEITALTLNPSLALSVINKMPNLLSSPYKDLVSSLNRYVPLAVVNQFYTAYPQLKEAVKKLPKRTGITPSWNETDPLRLQLLEQTPWLRQAQGRQVRQADLINLFDDKIVSSALEREMKNITKFQNKNGAFSWFAGGPDDVYLTLYALRSFGEALSYQAQIPQQSAKKAFAYVLPKIEEQLRRDSKGSVQAVSYALYAAYTLSSFPGEWKEVSQAKPYIKRWIEYADKYAKFMTPLGQVYAAVIYHRLGDDVKANSYLDRVLSRLKQDPLTGAYFAPEAQSWLWYNDTLTTQTVTLRALLEMRPQSDKIDALTQWLLFNRQVNDWTDSKAASQAVFTLLDIMKTKGALSTPSSYKIQWGGQTRALTFEPLDWTEDLQFVRTDSPADKSTANARITKQGPQTDFASLSAVYQTANADASPKGVINVERNYFLRQKQGQTTKLLPIDDLTKVRVGDEIEVHLTLNTDSAFEYVLLQDPKPAGFESEALLSGWDYQNLSFYREVKDAATHFFINWVPRGTVTLHYILRPTVAGQLHALPAQAQSMYAPQYGAHSASSSFHIEK